MIVFNRPELTRRVFERVAAVRPRQLFVIADGPRPERPDDAERCRVTQEIVEAVDWPCDLQTNVSATNLGLKSRWVSGFEWVFGQVDRAIILEDDTLPEPTFFSFCEELLQRYEYEPRVRTIVGSNFLGGRARTADSYHFSEIHNIWGWATWRRSWARCDPSMHAWPEIRNNGWLVDLVGSRRMAKFWGSRFNNTYEGRNSSWAYPYQLSCWLDGALAVTPNRNLVSNIGFGAGATHTPVKKSYMDLTTTRMSFPLRHPPFIVADRVSDAETFKRRLLPEDPSLAWYAARRVYYFLRRKPHVFGFKLASVKLREQPDSVPRRATETSADVTTEASPSSGWASRLRTSP